MKQLTATATITIKWWVKPLINLIAFIRLPINIEKLSSFLAKHGVKYEIKF